MSWTIQSNSTVTTWKAYSGTDILFPETKIDVGGKKKLRGGAPVCCPNFGTAPTDGPYRGIELPKHGLVRDCHSVNDQPIAGSPVHYQEGPQLKSDGWVRNWYTFTAPWSHEVAVEVKCESKSTSDLLMHIIKLRAGKDNESQMPYSLGLHPYFATGGKPFVLRSGDDMWRSTDLEVDQPFFTPIVDARTPFRIELLHGTVTIVPIEGYTDYCIWTDRLDLYICVEPVQINGDSRYFMLSPKEARRSVVAVGYRSRT